LKRCICILSVLTVAAAMFVAGCGKTSDQPVAKPAAVPVVDISTLPEFLRYPGAAAVERMALNWTLVSADPQPQIEEWYRASVEKAGWVKDPEGGKVGMIEWIKPDKTETIKMMVYEKDGKNNISLTQALKLKP
jgi:hypothetical protein